MGEIMSEHDFLYLVWKNPQNRRNYTVGKLSRNADGYTFEYCNESKLAQADGWNMIQAFPEIKKYESKDLFPAFSSRLPDRRRRNIEEVLKKYHLDCYDGFELLKRSGGRLPIDTYEFVDPIFDEDVTVEKEFYIAGIRHSSGCEGANCQNRPDLSLSMKLLLVPEPTNEYDANAVQVQTENKHILGYIPRYFSKSISNRLNNGMTYECTIIELCDNQNCQECVKVKLVMPKREKV